LVRRWRGKLTAAPLFPSLLQEAKVGFDVKLRIPGLVVFLQFKLSEGMMRGSAREISRDGYFTPSTNHSAAFYRMHLRPLRHSRQHTLLLKLDHAGHHVCYAAPRFHTAVEFNAAYLNRQIARRSVFIRPRAIGPLPDRNDHYVAFGPTGTVGYRYSSDPVELRGPAQSEQELTRELVSLVQNSSVSTEGLRHKAESMVEILSQDPPLGDRGVDFASFLEDRTPAESVAYLSRVFFHCEPIVVTARGRD
jgi:hypothetical protein